MIAAELSYRQGIRSSRTPVFGHYRWPCCWKIHETLPHKSYSQYRTLRLHSSYPLQKIPWKVRMVCIRTCHQGFKLILYRLVWHQIPRQAIIGHVSLAEIQRLAERNNCISAMLRPLKISPNVDAARLAFEQGVLGSRPGITIGALLGLFLPQTQINEPIVMDFITMITQNWSNCDRSIPVDIQSKLFWNDIAGGLELPYQAVSSHWDAAQIILHAPSPTYQGSLSTIHAHFDDVQTPIRREYPQMSQSSTPLLTYGLSQSESDKTKRATSSDGNDDDLYGRDSATIGCTRISVEPSSSVVELDDTPSDNVQGGWLPLLPGIESYMDSSLPSTAASQHATPNQKTGAQICNDGQNRHDNLSMRIKDVVKREPGTGDWVWYRDECTM